MQKPQLSDYGLNEQSHERLEKQNNEYKVAWARFCKQMSKRNLIVGLFAAIPSVILFMITLPLWSKLNNTGEGSTALIIILLGIAIAYPIIVCKLFYLGDDTYTKFSQAKRDRFAASCGYKGREAFVDNDLEAKISKYNKALEEYKDITDKSRSAYWSGLNAYEFEREVANLYALLGYSTRVTKSTGDGGVDIIMTKDSERIGVQCKHHAKPVGPDPVRSLIGVVASQGFDFGIFVSLNGFTATVRTELANSRVKIIMVSCADLCELAQTV